MKAIPILNLKQANASDVDNKDIWVPGSIDDNSIPANQRTVRIKISDFKSLINAILSLIPPGTSTDNLLMNESWLMQILSNFSAGFFEYQGIETFIVQTEADLPTPASPIPPVDGDTALYMDATKTIVYKTTYTAGVWGTGIEVSGLKPGWLWTESSSESGYYFMPEQDWNQLDVKPLASAIGNDSTVTGTTVKDALQTLYNKSDDFRKWKEDNNYLIAGKGATGTPANAVILVNNPPSAFNQPNVVYIGNGGGKTNNSVIIKTDIGTYPDSFYTTPTKCIAIGGNFGDGKVNQDINIGYDNNGSWGGGSIVTKTIRIGRNIPIAGQGYDNVAIGDNIDFQYNSNRNCVLGTGSAVRGLYDINNAVILGYDSTHTGSNTVSVGSASLKRRICNVADGTANSDVATVGQLYASTSAMFKGSVQLLLSQVQREISIPVNVDDLSKYYFDGQIVNVTDTGSTRLNILNSISLNKSGSSAYLYITYDPTGLDPDTNLYFNYVITRASD